MFKEVADIKTADMLDLPVPKANFHNISVKPSEIQKQMVAELAERAEKVRNGMVDASVDNMLKITNDGRKLALDQRLINPMLPDFEGSKLNACVDAMFETWENGKEKRLTQLFFCDLSTPKNDGNFSVYDDIRKKLVERGVPADEIKFIHEADTEAKKQLCACTDGRGKENKPRPDYSRYRRNYICLGICSRRTYHFNYRHCSRYQGIQSKRKDGRTCTQHHR